MSTFSNQANAAIDALVQPHLLDLQPYATARHEYVGTAEVYLDANESPFNTTLNRYPDPAQKDLRTEIALQKGLRLEQVFTGQGSDEAIDLLTRLCCRPGIDEVIVCPPTYGVYAIAARLQQAKVVEVPLTADFQLDVAGILAASNPNSKILWLCSPNNPTGNLMAEAAVLELLHAFPGLVVVDEAYIDFAQNKSWSAALADFPRLVVLQTMSKGWGLAAVRLGMAFAHPRLIELLQRIKSPYNLSGPSQQTALERLQNATDTRNQIDLLVAERHQLATDLSELPSVLQVYPSQANFLLVRFQNARATYELLLQNGILVRDRSTVPGCEGCLRISLGTPTENKKLLQILLQA
jgi:histidinol-phosphate aminotransferase